MYPVTHIARPLTTQAEAFAVDTIWTGITKITDGFIELASAILPDQLRYTSFLDCLPVPNYRFNLTGVPLSEMVEMDFHLKDPDITEVSSYFKFKLRFHFSLVIRHQVVAYRLTKIDATTHEPPVEPGIGWYEIFADTGIEPVIQSVEVRTLTEWSQRINAFLATKSTTRYRSAVHDDALDPTWRDYVEQHHLFPDKHPDEE